MSLSASGRTWEEASCPAAVRLARRFEAAWRGAADSRPDPGDFLPDDAHGYPGARLALLRADMALRWEAGSPVGAAWYRERYPDLGGETLVALIYEEFCLREEEQGAPDPAEFLARFPEVGAQLRRVLDIHGLVGSGQPTTASLPAPGPAGVAFPGAGQTIAGFHLVEELGRGAFARVFLARERQLADRPVALKVARSGSREPQTLARLQHTHIVPVYSSRTDPSTGLHLLCMPYFGRLTLARVLADPKVREARTGAELVEALDRLGPPEGPPSGRTAGRAALVRRTYARAIAWWGARMAEALDHAHDRGVLHRDIKPSNVLVTGDGMPMLLDFNLAREAVSDDPDDAPAALGGTLDYMAPEHLDALADGLADRLDGRSDIYGLGVLLYEALTGARPFTTPRNAASGTELLLRAAEERRRAAPWLRATRPEVPAALEAVVRRCLAPDPSDRYATAADLAADLQAVADDLPLRFAREPIPSRALRWLRRHRRPIAMTAPVVVALAAIVAVLVMDRVEEARRRGEIAHLNEQGKNSYLRGEFAKAIVQFNSAARLAEGRAAFEDLFRKAREGVKLAEETGRIRDEADRLFRAAVPLRFRVLDFGGDLASASRELNEVLKPFYVLVNANWANRPDLWLLDEPRRLRLIGEVNELLFLWAVALDRSDDPEAIRNAIEICDRAILFAEPRGPWQALRARLEARRAGRTAPMDATADRVSAETSALACYQWGLLRALEGRRARAIAWLKQAVRIKPGAYWYRYYLAYCYDQTEDLSDVAYKEAMKHYEAAFALRPDLPWVRFSRARLYRRRGAWSPALDDFRRALDDARALPDSARDPAFESQARLEMGLVHQSLGDGPAARADYATAIASDPTGDYARAARFNRARLDADDGAVARARGEYDALLAERPDDPSPRLGRALLALRLGQAAAAEADLTALLTEGRGHPAELRAHRALARLLLRQPSEAEADAAAAARLEPTPGHERLRTRTLLALGRARELPLDAPEQWARLPVAGPALAADLRTSAERLRTQPTASEAAALQALLTRAVLLSALRDPEAEAEATRAVALAPLSAQVYLVRAWLRHHRGAIPGALADIEQGLALQPDDPRLWQWRGRLHREAGDPGAALADLDRALRLGAEGAARGDRAAALLALGDAEGAVRDWSLALAHDPDDPRAYLGRARAFLRLRQWDQALADLEQAAGWADARPGLLFEIALANARCLPEHPQRLPRVVALARRAWSAAISSNHR
ncbi:MAG TPA: serine/threonine-protein kinase [Isosphaeraceae bacterium]|nr:serine/threonine-protein kinase [Isosphaeraceae bacterium]